MVFAKTGKALARLNEMFRNGDVKKTYWAIVKECPKETEGELVHYLVRNEKQNKSYAYDKEVKNSKKAILHYKLIGHSQNYLSAGGGFKDRTSSPDTLSAGKNGMSYQRRFEIWCSAFQSGW